MIQRDAVPIAHIPPRAPIDLRPTWPARPEPYKNCWELAAEEEEARRKAKRDEAMWRAVCDVARTCGGEVKRQDAVSRDDGPAPVDFDSFPVLGEGETQTRISGASEGVLEALQDGQNVMIDGDGEQRVFHTRWYTREEFDALYTFVPSVPYEQIVGEWRDESAPEFATTLTTTQAGRLVTHSKDCGYWTDFYSWECDCGAKEG